MLALDSDMRNLFEPELETLMVCFGSEAVTAWNFEFSRGSVSDFRFRLVFSV